MVALIAGLMSLLPSAMPVRQYAADLELASRGHQGLAPKEAWQAALRTL